MQTQKIKLEEILTRESAEKISALLRQQQGVSEVVFSYLSNECDILFDEKNVSQQQLQAILVSAGHTNQAVKKVHGQNGVCCGSCGG